MNLYISKITNHEQVYTMVDVFSSYELAEEFQKKFSDNFYIDGMRSKYDIQIETCIIDTPSYPFLNNM